MTDWSVWWRHHVAYHFSVQFCEQTRSSCNWPSTGLWLVEDL